jgi:hypothetical protein
VTEPLTAVLPSLMSAERCSRLARGRLKLIGTDLCHQQSSHRNPHRDASPSDGRRCCKGLCGRTVATPFGAVTDGQFATNRFASHVMAVAGNSVGDLKSLIAIGRHKRQIEIW